MKKSLQPIQHSPRILFKNECQLKSRREFLYISVKLETLETMVQLSKDDTQEKVLVPHWFYKSVASKEIGS